MKVKLTSAFICLTLIWSTTPLGIHWSSQSVGFLFAVTSRMTIATCTCFILLRLLGISFPWHKDARQTYLASSISIYAAMMLVYWGAQFIPSGWVAVIFGASPMITSLIAHRYLNENALTPAKITGITIGLLGLIVIFWTNNKIDQNAYFGLFAILTSALVHNMAMVRVKQIDATISPLATTSGGLVLALPAYILTWLIFDGQWPVDIPTRTALAIIYLGLIASVIGFALYYFILKHLDASRVALITLITPVGGLLLGNILNGEALSHRVWIGTALIIIGLACYEFVGQRKIG